MDLLLILLIVLILLGAVGGIWLSPFIWIAVGVLVLIAVLRFTRL
jgi:hypothetical protein